MKCFDVVSTVLNATYEEVPNKKGDRDELVKKALKATREQYRENLMEEGGPDFDDPATRFGYIFSYVPAHAHWIYELIKMCPSAQAVFERGKVRVACLGGGPGSDVVGILKYIDERALDCKLFVELIDGCEAWKATWSDLAFQLDWDDPLHTDYVIHNVADEGTWESPSHIAKADLITLSFFASEIFYLENAKKYLSHMLERAKPGAIVLVNDNMTPEVWEMIDRIALDLGLEKLLKDKGERKIYDAGESLAAVEDYAKKFNSQSRLTGWLFWRAFRKP